jgi:hypothetical protein
MAGKLPALFDPRQVEERVERPRPSSHKLGPALAIGLIEVMYVLAGQASGPASYVLAGAVGVGAYLAQGWAVAWWRRHVSVPAELAEEAIVRLREENAKLSTELVDKKRCKETAAKLQRLWEVGLHRFLNAKIETPDDVVRWRRQREQWIQELFTVVHVRCTPAEASRIMNLLDVPMTGSYHPNNELNHEFNMIAEILRRLRTVVERYDGLSST